MSLGLDERIAARRSLCGQSPIARRTSAIASLIEVQRQLRPDLARPLTMGALERVTDPQVGVCSSSSRHPGGQYLAIEWMSESKATSDGTVRPCCTARVPQKGAGAGKPHAALLGLPWVAVRAGGRGRGGELELDEARSFEKLAVFRLQALDLLLDQPA